MRCVAQGGGVASLVPLALAVTYGGGRNLGDLSFGTHKLTTSDVHAAIHRSMLGREGFCEILIINWVFCLSCIYGVRTILAKLKPRHQNQQPIPENFEM